MFFSVCYQPVSMLGTFSDFYVAIFDCGLHSRIKGCLISQLDKLVGGWVGWLVGWLVEQLIVDTVSGV